MLTYKQVFAKAWEVAKLHPRLWVFGVFAAVLTRVLQAGMIIFWDTLATNGVFNISLADLWQVGLDSPVRFLTAQTMLFFIVVVMLVMVWLVLAAQAALVYETLQAAAHRTTGWGALVRVGFRKSWGMLALYGLALLITWALLLPFSFISNPQGPVAFLGYLLAFVLIIPLIAVIFLVLKYAVCGMVLHQQPVGQALAQGTQLFSRHWLLTVEVGFLLFVLFGAIRYVVSFLIGLALIGALVVQDIPGVQVTAQFLFGALDLAVGTILAVFSWTAWVTVYESLLNPRVRFASFLQRMFGGAQ